MQYIMQTPLGFSFAGVAAGLKPVRRDVALVVSDVPCAAAGAFTTNLAAAAPVIDARPRVPASGIRAVVVNSGNANALTGPRASPTSSRSARRSASALGVSAEAVPDRVDRRDRRAAAGGQGHRGGAAARRGAVAGARAGAPRRS